MRALRNPPLLTYEEVGSAKPAPTLQEGGERIGKRLKAYWAEKCPGWKGNASYLRWRILARMRRFFRPTLRRPLPRRAPICFLLKKADRFVNSGIY